MAGASTLIAALLGVTWKFWLVHTATSCFPAMVVARLTGRGPVAAVGEILSVTVACVLLIGVTTPVTPAPKLAVTGPPRKCVNAPIT